MTEHRKQMARAADEVRGILDKAQARRPGGGRPDRQASPGRGRSWPSSGPSGTSRSARDQALAEIWQKTADMAVSVAGRVLSKELTDDRPSPLAGRRDPRAARRARGQRPRRESLMTDPSGAVLAEAPVVADDDRRGRPPLRRGPDRRGRARRGRRSGARRARRDRARRSESLTRGSPRSWPRPGFRRPRRTGSWSTCSRTALRASSCGSCGSSIATSGWAYFGVVVRRGPRHLGSAEPADPGPGSLGCSAGREPVDSHFVTGSPG